VASEETSPKRSAREQSQFIQGRLRYVNATLNALSARPGLAPELSDSCESLRARITDVTARHAETWGQINQPTLAAAKQKVVPLRNHATQLKAQKDATEQQAAQISANPAAAGQVAQLRAQAATLGTQASQAESTAKAAEDEVASLLRDQEKALSAPNDTLDALAKELESLHRQSNDLLEEVNGREKAWGAWQGVEPRRDELRDGVKFHRGEATWQRRTMLILAFAVGVLLIETSHDFNASTTSAILVGLFIGVRATCAAVLTGLIVFSGKLHTRHSRQAVIYQEKLVGLDVVQMVVVNSNAETVRGIVQRLARTYLRAPADAFRDAHQDADASWGATLKLAKKAASLQGTMRGEAEQPGKPGRK